MKITLPADCGNAPRMVIVADFASSWASGDSKGLADNVADDVDWTFTGLKELPFEPEALDVLTVVTHGRVASCDGYVTRGDRRVNFFHMIRFANTAKTAKIVEVRTYIGDGAAA